MDLENQLRQKHAYPVDSHVQVFARSRVLGKELTRKPGTGSGNNYAYLVVDDETQDGMIIDPANPPE
jgi:hypothetical protein